MKNISRLRHFVQAFTGLIDQVGTDEERIFSQGKPLLSALVSVDDWLPDEYAKASPERYQQYLLWCDPLERFSMVSFVWGPGQTTPVHDHTVWGMVGVLRGAETCEEFALDAGSGPLQAHGSHHLACGAIDLVSPRVGDIHKVSNALADQTSVSIHLYGANIGRVQRHVYDANTGAMRDFVSGYSNNATPNLWQS